MGTLGYGTTLSGATTGAIGEIVDVGLPDQTVDDVDVSTSDSPDKFMEFIPGMINAGQISLQLVYEKANYNTVQGALGADPEIWTITFPDGSTFACSGYIKANGGSSPIKDKIGQSVTLKLSGKPTFTPAV